MGDPERVIENSDLFAHLCSLVGKATFTVETATVCDINFKHLCRLGRVNVSCSQPGVQCTEVIASNVTVWVLRAQGYLRARKCGAHKTSRMGL